MLKIKDYWGNKKIRRRNNVIHAVFRQAKVKDNNADLNDFP